MSNLDQSLLHRARKLTNGANVHIVKTWMLCYELSQPDSLERDKYERLLRQFVARSRLDEGAEQHWKSRRLA